MITGTVFTNEVGQQDGQQGGGRDDCNGGTFPAAILALAMAFSLNMRRRAGALSTYEALYPIWQLGNGAMCGFSNHSRCGQGECGLIASSRGPKTRLVLTRTVHSACGSNIK